MYAVIRTGGKQHRVVTNDRIVVERLNCAPGETIELDEVLMLADTGQEPMIGASVPSGARVFAEVIAQQRGPKLIVFKKKRRKNYRRTRGHRQEQTVLRIAGISLSGERPESAQSAAETPPAPSAPDLGQAGPGETGAVVAGNSEESKE